MKKPPKTKMCSNSGGFIKSKSLLLKRIISFYSKRITIGQKQGMNRNSVMPLTSLLHKDLQMFLY